MEDKKQIRPMVKPAAFLSRIIRKKNRVKKINSH